MKFKLKKSSLNILAMNWKLNVEIWRLKTSKIT
jgi:hypothetical protein